MDGDKRDDPSEIALRDTRNAGHLADFHRMNSWILMELSREHDPANASARIHHYWLEKIWQAWFVDCPGGYPGKGYLFKSSNSNNRRGLSLNLERVHLVSGAAAHFSTIDLLIRVGFGTALPLITAGIPEEFVYRGILQTRVGPYFLDAYSFMRESIASRYCA